MFDRLQIGRRSFMHHNFQNFLALLLLVFPVSAVFDALWFDHRCTPNNCSQGKRFETDHIFPCIIGGLKDVDEFNKSVMNLKGDLLSDNLGNTVLLRSVNWYLSYAFTDKTTGKKLFNPSLNITFQLPSHSNDVRAVLMTFSSPKDPQVADSFYSLANNTRVRLFDFRNYMPLEYDLEHPRSVSYRCLVGLDHLHNNRVYTVALRALPFGEQVEYSIITNSKDQFIENFTVIGNLPSSLSSWRSTVAVGLLKKQRKLHVVFEPAPIKFRVTKYTVQLLWQQNQNSSNQILASKVITHDSQICSCLFPITVLGTYHVKVLLKGENCHGNCLEVLSYSVDIKSQGYITKKTKDNIKIYLMFGGTSLGILLLIIMAVVLQREYRQYMHIKQVNSCSEEEDADSIQRDLANCSSENRDSSDVRTDSTSTPEDASHCYTDVLQRSGNENMEYNQSNRKLEQFQTQQTENGDNFDLGITSMSEYSCGMEARHCNHDFCEYSCGMEARHCNHDFCDTPSCRTFGQPDCNEVTYEQVFVHSSPRFNSYNGRTENIHRPHTKCIYQPQHSERTVVQCEHNIHRPQYESGYPMNEFS